MIKTWTYNGVTYQSEWQVRQDIFNKDHVSFGEAPDEGKVEFWAQFGVTYTEEPDPAPTLEQLKQTKLRELEVMFKDWYEDCATLISSLGFEADSDAKAKMDVDGLVTKAEAQPTESQARYSVTFMDANNEAHPVTLEQLKVLQIEIIDSGIAAYNEKWAFREAINNAQSEDELNAVHIVFTKQHFSHVG